jgi:hypothetical protein|tara:strand:+ start:313 stop:609 length:297 start_codon:yes stop_codon:yes gene_type:complete
MFIQKSHSVVINNEEFPLSLFLQLAPNYEVVDYREYAPENTHTYIVNGIQRGGPLVWEEGNRYLKINVDLKYLDSQNKLDEEERKIAVEVTKKSSKTN